MQPLKERLVFRRNRVGWDQKKLALESGVSERSISDYETGKAMPTPRILEKLAAALEVSTIWLMGGGELDVLKDALPPKEVPPTLKYMGSETLIRAIQDAATHLGKVRPHERKFVVGNLRSLLDAFEDQELKGEPERKPELSEEEKRERATSVAGKMSLAAGSAALQRESAGSEPSEKAASSSDNSGAPGARSPGNPSRPRTPQGQAPK